MGWETFTAGLKIYFKDFAWKNTELPDFIGAMQRGYDGAGMDEPLNLNDWSTNWLQTKGVNKHSAEFE